MTTLKESIMPMSELPANATPAPPPPSPIRQVTPPTPDRDLHKDHPSNVPVVDVAPADPVVP